MYPSLPLLVRQMRDRSWCGTLRYTRPSCETLARTRHTWSPTTQPCSVINRAWFLRESEWFATINGELERSSRFPDNRSTPCPVVNEAKHDGCHERPTHNADSSVTISHVALSHRAEEFWQRLGGCAHAPCRDRSWKCTRTNQANEATRMNPPR
jgi:hypothetical protein